MSESTAARVIDLLQLGQVTSIAVASTGVAYGKSFPIFRGCTYSFDVQFDSSGTVGVTVELEQSDVRPDTEGAVDTKYVVPDNKTVPMFSAIANKLRHNVAYTPNATAFARLRYTGVGSNHSSTTATMSKVTTIKDT